MEKFKFSVRYPFTAKARGIIEENNVSITDRIVELALERIKLALKEGKLPKSVALHDSERVEEIASYATARMILGYSKNRYLINKYAVAESKRASSYLESENEEIIEEIAKEFQIVSSMEGEYLVLPVYTYLKYSPRSIDYKLINRELFDGYVRIKPREKIRIIEEAIRKHMEKIPLVKSPPETIKIAAEKLKEFLPKVRKFETSISLASGELPPCVEKLIDSLKKHENLPHQARWYLAVYLINSGMPVEEMINLYSNLPDYSEKVTRYQIEHAKKKEYSVPSCATVLTWGLCCADCRIGNPMNWRKLRKYDKEKIIKTGKRYD